MGNKILISEGNRPIWQRLIAAALYTAVVMLLYSFFIGFEFSLATKKLKGSLRLLEGAILLFATALTFSIVRDVHFDLDNKRYKLKYCVGPIGVGQWQKLPVIEYVSVFKQPKEGGDFIFETNLWYQKNKHFNVYENESKEAAYEMGLTVAKLLKVKLLDATVPHENKWIHITEA